MVLSLADVCGDRAILTRFLTSAKLGVETLGPEGCRIYCDGEVAYIPVTEEIEIDPTGAGDIFAAAFFIRYQATRSFLRAGRFANACASLSVGKRGMDSIPSPKEIDEHLLEIYGNK